MNIVFLLRPWPVYGGGETVTIALANEFVKRGHIVHVLYTRLVSNKKHLLLMIKLLVVWLLVLKQMSIIIFPWKIFSTLILF